MGESILGTLRRQFEDDKERIQDSVINGEAKDWAGYRHAIGTVRGIERCLDKVKTLEKTLLESEFDD